MKNIFLKRAKLIINAFLCMFLCFGFSACSRDSENDDTGVVTSLNNNWSLNDVVFQPDEIWEESGSMTNTKDLILNSKEQNGISPFKSCQLVIEHTKKGEGTYDIVDPDTGLIYPEKQQALIQCNMITETGSVGYITSLGGQLEVKVDNNGHYQFKLLGGSLTLNRSWSMGSYAGTPEKLTLKFSQLYQQ